MRVTLVVLAVHAVGPLFCESFVKDLPTEFIGQLVPKWEALRSRSRSQVASLYADLFLRAGPPAPQPRKGTRAAIAARINQNPIRSRLMLPDKIEFGSASSTTLQCHLPPRHIAQRPTRGMNNLAKPSECMAVQFPLVGLPLRFQRFAVGRLAMPSF